MQSWITKGEISARKQQRKRTVISAAIWTGIALALFIFGH